MSPELSFITGFGVAAAVAWLLRRRGMKRISGLEREKQELLVEESRMFSFLHDLGENLGHERGQRRLHGEMATGVTRVVEAQGGVLYLLDRTGLRLVPASVTGSCPPLIDVPEHVRAAPHSQSSWLQLESIPAEAGLIGRCFSTQTPMLVEEMGEWGHLFRSLTNEQAAARIMLAPLTLGTRKMGVIAVAQTASHPAFTGHQFDVFRSVAEQSAFALAAVLVQQEAADKRRIEDELRSASEVQRILLPESPPQCGAYRIATACQPAKVMSGDYYDFIPLDQDHTGVVIADVSGKGIPASLVMATCRALLRGLAGTELSPSTILGRVNRMIFDDIREDMFISLACCILDSRSSTITLSRAGHDAPLLFSSASGTTAPIKPPGLAIGIDAGKVFERVTKDHTFSMAAGDCLLLYTDGVNEATNAAGDEFGLLRMQEVFAAAAPGGAQAAVDALKAEVAKFVDGHPQSDDITIIVIERLAE